MASMSYCRWQNIREDLQDAMGAFYQGKLLNEDENSAMKDCCEMFVELLQHGGRISKAGYKEINLALMDVYAEIDAASDEEEDEDD